MASPGLSECERRNLYGTKKPLWYPYRSLKGTLNPLLTKSLDALSSPCEARIKASLDCKVVRSFRQDPGARGEPWSFLRC